MKNISDVNRAAKIAFENLTSLTHEFAWLFIQLFTLNIVTRENQLFLITSNVIPEKEDKHEDVRL